MLNFQGVLPMWKRDLKWRFFYLIVDYLIWIFFNGIHVWYIYLHVPETSTKCRQICHTWMAWVWVKHGFSKKNMLWKIKRGRLLVGDVNLALVLRTTLHTSFRVTCKVVLLYLPVSLWKCDLIIFTFAGNISGPVRVTWQGHDVN